MLAFYLSLVTMLRHRGHLACYYLKYQPCLLETCIPAEISSQELPSPPFPDHLICNNSHNSDPLTYFPLLYYRVTT